MSKNLLKQPKITDMFAHFSDTGKETKMKATISNTKDENETVKIEQKKHSTNFVDDKENKIKNIQENHNTLEKIEEDVAKNKISPPDAFREALEKTLTDKTWLRILIPELNSAYMKPVWHFLSKEDNKAHGLCFSVPKGVLAPPSLKNIYKELLEEYPNFRVPNHGCLVPWASQGVFMLNATLTVEAHKANSHSSIGWQKFTDNVIRIISKESKNGIVFLLWGGFAHKKEALVDKKKHVVIKSAHPSPLSYHLFKGSGCFRKANEKLLELGREAIDWNCL